MKKLLSLLTISTLIVPSVISASNVLNVNILKENFKSIANNYIENQNTELPKQLPNFKEQGIGAIAVDGNGNIYVGADDGTNGRLYKSTDGINFNKVMDTPKAYIDDIVTYNQNIYVSTNGNGLYKSTDGTNFNKINDINYVNSLAIDSNGIIYAGTKTDGLYKSIDDGVTFNKVGSIVGFINKIIFGNHGMIFVSAYNGGLYKSTDGINFNKIMDTPKNYASAIAVDGNGNIYLGLSWAGLYKSTDGTNFNKINAIDNSIITGILVISNQNIYISTNGNGLYKSTDGTNFNKIISTPNNIRYNSLIATNNDIVYMGTYAGSGGVWTINLSNNILKFAKPNYYGEKYNGFVYKTEQKIDIKSKYLDNATLDGNTLTVPSQNVPITVGKHTLVLSLKNEYKKNASLFNADNNGQITYNFWIKTSIDPINELNFRTTTSDTDLLTGLISNTGNTNNSPIVQTRAKSGSGSHEATLNINISSNMIDLVNSYYVLGVVDESTNNFTETGNRIKNLPKNFAINTDGTYHLHLVDSVGNIYDSYLELGDSNWKLKGSFNDKDLTDLSSKLNVTVNLHDPTEKQKAMGWLQNYQADADKAFTSSITSKGKGFNFTINDLLNGYKEFLDPITYNNPDSKEAINQSNLDKAISDLANKDLTDGLNKLSKDLNIDTSNVINKSTLDSYSNWIRNYNDFINDNKKVWIDQVSAIASRRFASTTEVQQIQDYLNSLNFSKYLKHVIWTPTADLARSNDYKQFVELDKLQSDTIDWVNKTIPNINGDYQKAINNAESGLNLHGYSIDQLLNGKSKPQTKSEINNFANGQSYHEFLQSQANTRFKSYQLKMGLGIGIPLVLFSLGVGIFFYWRFSKKNQPYSENINKD